MAHEDVPLVIQRQSNHSNLGITSVYLQGIDNAELIDTFTPPSADDPSQRIASALKHQAAALIARSESSAYDRRTRVWAPKGAISVEFDAPNTNVRVVERRPCGKTDTREGAAIISCLA